MARKPCALALSQDRHWILCQVHLNCWPRRGGEKGCAEVDKKRTEQITNDVRYFESLRDDGGKEDDGY